MRVKYVYENFLLGIFQIRWGFEEMEKRVDGYNDKERLL